MEPIAEVARELDRRVESLGFEVVDAHWSGSPARPVLRLRVDRPDSRPGHGVTVQDCATVSRALEAWMDELPSVPERYVLEVSSPGVERPLVRERDFRRFEGREARVKLRGPGLPPVFEGRLDGVQETEGGFRVTLLGRDGTRVEVDDASIVRAHLLFDWEGGDA